jgi:serine/threonine protein kinase
MPTDPATTRLAASDEPIPGYRLIEPLGAGGFGEVWKVSAPGGVSKSIKIIFDDPPSRGTMELRALNRIKDVRHPFLLSIERIEQRPGMAAIVTELADRNLQQYCQTYRDKGLPGIPQQELLTMLRDVADVLDYIYQEFALQHLDIKASNLLVFGKRLKVGDFGLVKNIYESSASLVDGMTPAYAAPEVFAGKPTGYSDQYSLAIVYQEMLTGVLPFCETSPARLAMRHLHDVPNLRSLPAAQQPIVARALSKDPQQRFPSCTAFVDELAAAVRRAEFNEPHAPADLSLSKDLAPRTDARRNAPSADSATRTSAQKSAAAAAKPRAAGTASASLANAPLDNHVAPTLVIGIGGGAAELLQRLGQRIGDRLGAESAPAFKLVLIDSDPDTLNAVNRHHDVGDVLEKVHAPLLSAAEYRIHGQKQRRWLSRRWLFNIPRDLRTDGLRPLGRLALLTNGPRVRSAIRSAIGQVASAEWSCVGNRPVAGTLRILIVASISGGTGSGMFLDVAYAARTELQLAGLNQAAVEGLLLHSTPVGIDRDKAVLNAVAALKELTHYGMPGNCYPGEPLLDVPPFHGNNRTFSHAQLVHLGDKLDEATWLRAVDNAAEYVFSRLTTPRNQFHAQRPQPPMDAVQGDAATVDVVQVRQIGGYFDSFIHRLARRLCFEIVGGWCDSPVSSFPDKSTTQQTSRLIQTILHNNDRVRYQQFVDSAAVRVQGIGIELARLMGSAREKLVQELGVDEQSYLKLMYQGALQSHGKETPSEPKLAALVLSLQDRVIGLDFGERQCVASRNTLFDMLHSRLGSQAMQLSAKFTNWVHDLVDHPDARVEGARYAAEAGRNYIHDLVGVVAKEMRAIHKRQIESRILLTSPEKGAEGEKSGWWRAQRGATHEKPLEDRLLEHGMLCFEELILACVQLQLQSIEAQASAVIDKLVLFAHELKQFGARFEPEPDDGARDNAANPLEYEHALQQLLLSHQHYLVKELRRRIDEEVLKGPKKLQRFLSDGGAFDQQLREPLQYHARQIVLESLRHALLIQLRRGKGAEGADAFNLDSVLASHLQEPLKLGSPEGEQAYVVVPSDSAVAHVKRRLEALGHHVQAVAAPSNNIAVCRESPANSLRDLIQQVAEHRTQLIQLADHLRSRVDVAWEPLHGSVQPETPGAGALDAILGDGAEFPETLCLSNVADTKECDPSIAASPEFVPESTTG